MGCLAGPVTVCAVSLTPEFYGKYKRELAGLRDSKLLSPEQRKRYSQVLKNLRISYAVVSESPRKIDKLNIFQATRQAMRKAVVALRQAQGNQNGRTIVLVDGPHKISGLGLDQMPIVKGDQKVFAIACASIIAKVHRDRIMTRYVKKYPEYGFESHKGYGTKLHLQKISLHGITPIHRRSFHAKLPI